MNKAGEANRSVRSTKRRLRECLLELLADKPINEISVKELTERADMNRGTFYFHYQDIYDLLRQTEDEFFAQFDEMLWEAGEDPSGQADPYLRDIFAFLGENRKFCRIMLGPHGDMQFVERVKKRVDDQCSLFWQVLAPKTEPARYGMYNAFIINGCVGLIGQWLNDSAGLTVDKVAELAAKIILTSVGPCIHGD